MPRAKKEQIKTRKYVPSRPNVVIYRDKRGQWHVASHASIDRAIAHSRRVVETETGTPVFMCHILYEEKRIT